MLGMLLAVSASSAATGNLGLTSAPGGFELLSPAAPPLVDYLSILHRLNDFPKACWKWLGT